MRYEDFKMPTWMSMLIGTGVIEVQFLGISERYIFIAYQVLRYLASCQCNGIIYITECQFRKLQGKHTETSETRSESQQQ